mmetsp:Transcript_11726/g.41429  ORF Transcript_11726/g.41429 Transcript_11726/m.41429 type:complete len:406 (-) Transcript_11726:121-1338(-)
MSTDLPPKDDQARFAPHAHRRRRLRRGRRGRLRAAVAGRNRVRRAAARDAAFVACWRPRDWKIAVSAICLKAGPAMRPHHGLRHDFRGADVLCYEGRRGVGTRSRRARSGGPRRLLHRRVLEHPRARPREDPRGDGAADSLRGKGRAGVQVVCKGDGHRRDQPEGEIRPFARPLHQHLPPTSAPLALRHRPRHRRRPGRRLGPRCVVKRPERRPPSRRGPAAHDGQATGRCGPRAQAPKVPESAEAVAHGQVAQVRSPRQGRLAATTLTRRRHGHRALLRAAAPPDWRRARPRDDPDARVARARLAGAREAHVPQVGRAAGRGDRVYPCGQKYDGGLRFWCQRRRHPRDGRLGRVLRVPALHRPRRFKHGETQTRGRHRRLTPAAGIWSHRPILTTDLCARRPSV